MVLGRSRYARLGRAAVFAAVLTAWGGCKEGPGGSPSVGSNSNWFRTCVGNDECEGLSCVCGACGRECTSDGDCTDLPGARCAPSEGAAAQVQCNVPTGADGVCLPRCLPGECRAGQACVDETCVLLELPDNAFCAPVQDPGPAARGLEDALLALLDELRAEGGQPCGATLALPAPAAQLDARLTCVARVRAADVRATGSVEPLDSDGRTPEQRLAEVGYSASLWAESFALRATSAENALELMRQDVDSCSRLSDPAFAAVGIGVAGDVAIVMLGAE